MCMGDPVGVNDSSASGSSRAERGWPVRTWLTDAGTRLGQTKVALAGGPQPRQDARNRQAQAPDRADTYDSHLLCLNTTPVPRDIAGPPPSSPSFLPVSCPSIPARRNGAPQYTPFSYATNTRLYRRLALSRPLCSAPDRA
jgi:hypothetical protein